MLAGAGGGVGVAEILVEDLVEGAGDAECFRSTTSPLFGSLIIIPALFFGFWKVLALGAGVLDVRGAVEV